MEDAATAEIARTQLWQWLHHGAKLSSGVAVTESFFKQVIAEEMEKIRTLVGDEAFKKGEYARAAELLAAIVLNKNFAEFLTLGAYDLVA
jgi:malate synthase